MTTYIVKKGDTLSKIAKQFGTTVLTIQKANSFITNVNNIEVGWSLTIPSSDKSKEAQVLDALEKCLEAIENLPEYKALDKLL